MYNPEHTTRKEASLLTTFLTEIQAADQNTAQQMTTVFKDPNRRNSLIAWIADHGKHEPIFRAFDNAGRRLNSTNDRVQLATLVTRAMINPDIELYGHRMQNARQEIDRYGWHEEHDIPDAVAELQSSAHQVLQTIDAMRAEITTSLIQRDPKRLESSLQNIRDAATNHTATLTRPPRRPNPHTTEVDQQRTAR